MKEKTDLFEADPGDDGYQYLENLSTAYWYSEVLFTALDLKLFSHLEQESCTITTLAALSCSEEFELGRLLRCLHRIGLVSVADDIWMNSQSASRYLVAGNSEYMGDFFLYRRYMQKSWQGLTLKLLTEKPEHKAELSYSERNRLYVGAMDALVRQKAKEIVASLKKMDLSGAVLDVGCGAGSMIREFQKEWPGVSGFVFDIPEVIDAAQILYPDPRDWQRITPLKGDFRSYTFENRFSLIILSNFLHAYGHEEAKDFLKKAVSLLEEGGALLIHDYFPDRYGVIPSKGPMYDLTMMLNTFNGSCHESGDILQWLKDARVENVTVKDLTTDTSYIFAGGSSEMHIQQNPWVELALAEGFDKATLIDPKEVVTAGWVNRKCRFGCERFDTNLQCPPHGLSHGETREMLDAYSCAVLVQGQPPGDGFHKKLLRLEKGAFLAGEHKAFVFGAGPCTICPECPEDGKCRHHNLARPSMEGSGIDVYSTVENAGWPLSPVKEKGDYVKYFGILLVS